MKLPTYQISLPASVRFDKSLPISTRLLYGEIKALCDQQGYCWAGNEYLASLYQVKPKVISRWISQLKNLGYLKVEVTKGNQRKIYVLSDPPKKDSPPPCLVEDIQPEVTGDLPEDRGGGDSVLIGNFIEYNDRIYSVSTPDSSTKKLRAPIGKKAEHPSGLPDEFVSSHADPNREHRPSQEAKSPTPRIPSPPPPQQGQVNQPFIKPAVPQVEEYMQQQKELCPDVLTARAHALRFVNYYESNGWKVGRNAMQDWKAAANNWLLNVKEYSDKALSASRNDIMSPNFDPYAPRLHSGGKKDYSIPL